MDVSELLAFRPGKGGNDFSGQSMKRKLETSEKDNPAKKRDVGEKLVAAKTESKLDVIDSLEQPEGEEMNELNVKKMLLQFEKKVLKNQELRIKYPETPEKFMDSEVELNEILQLMHELQPLRSIITFLSI